MSAYYVSGIGLGIRGNYNINIISAHTDFSMLVGGRENIFGATGGSIVSYNPNFGDRVWKAGKAFCKRLSSPDDSESRDKVEDGRWKGHPRLHSG